MALHGKRKTFYRWEAALLMGMGLALLLGTWVAGQQRALADQVVRLHVIGASDSAEDQRVKLQVRDAVLAQAGPWLVGVADQGEAVAILTEHLPQLAQVGSGVAGVPVTASVEEGSWFPTKQYTDFSLPAGRYTALKITVGEGEGRNWWCVVFPPLCLGSVSEEVAQRAGNFSQEQVKLVTGEEEGYVVKFKAMELLDEWNRWMSKERK